MYSEVEADMFSSTTTAILNRLDPRRTAVMTANATKQLEAIAKNAPEQVPFITTKSRGSDYQNRELLRLADLLAFYFAGPEASVAGGKVNVADEALQYHMVRC